jgi:Leucine-rich repeat (LRR) protein
LFHNLTHHSFLGCGILNFRNNVDDLNHADLFLSSNHFTGVIPNEIGNLGSLFNLYINDNNIRGSIPSRIGELTKLRGVSMFDNKIEGRIPDEIGNLKGAFGSSSCSLIPLYFHCHLTLLLRSKDIVALYLDTNKLTGQIPTTIGKLTKMVDLRLRVNNLSGTIPTELGALGNLEVRLKERVLVHDTIELTPGALCLFFQPTDVIP